MISQHRQDEWVVNYLNKKNGIFVDIGAHDGITLSNTYILEKNHGWSGVCIEPMPHQCANLIKNRTSHNYNVAISDEEGTDTFVYVQSNGYPDMLSGLMKDRTFKSTNEMIAEAKASNAPISHIKVNTMLLNDILQRENLTHIDYLTIDVEGSETRILRSIDYSTYSFSVIMFENPNNLEEPRSLLIEQGYRMATKLGPDDTFIKQ